MTAFVQVQQVTASTSAGVATATLVNPSASNIFIAQIGSGGVDTITSIVQTNVTWSQVVIDSGNGVSTAAIWKGIPSGGTPGTSVVVTTTNNSTGRVSIVEVTPPAGTLVFLNATASSSTNTTAMNTGTVTVPSGASAAYFSMVRPVSGTGYSSGPTNGFTELSSPSAFNRFAAKYNSNTTGAADSTGYVFGTTTYSSVIIAVYVAGAGGGGGNTNPTVSITGPADKSFSRNTQSLTFTASASDAEDGALSGASVVWTSDVDGALGTGTSLTKGANTLTPTVHTITCTVTDSNGNSTSASIIISVLKEVVLSYTALGVVGTWQQKISYFYPKNYTSPPAGGWCVKAYHGGSSSRSGSGNNDNDNTSWYEGNQFPSKILADPTGPYANCVGIFMQAPSTSVDNPFRHFCGMWTAMITDIASRVSINQNRLYWLSWSQGSLYALAALIQTPITQRPKWAAVITAAGWCAPGFATMVNGALGGSNASDTDRAAAANAMAASLAQTPYKQYQSANDANTLIAMAQWTHDAETNLPNSNFEYKDQSPVDHPSTGMNMAADSAIVNTWLEAQQLAGGVSSSGGIGYSKVYRFSFKGMRQFNYNHFSPR